MHAINCRGKVTVAVAKLQRFAHQVVAGLNSLRTVVQELLGAQFLFTSRLPPRGTVADEGRAGAAAIAAIPRSGSGRGGLLSLGGWHHPPLATLPLKLGLRDGSVLFGLAASHAPVARTAVRARAGRAGSVALRSIVAGRLASASS